MYEGRKNCKWYRTIYKIVTINSGVRFKLNLRGPVVVIEPREKSLAKYVAGLTDSLIF